MILPVDQVKQILQRRKTVLRIPRYPAQRCPIRVGRAYDIRAATARKTACHITILATHPATLQEVQLTDALAEGFRTRQEFFNAWEHDTNLTWVIQFQIGDTIDHPRLLAKRSQHGYTEQRHQALSEEPEAVPRSFQERLSERARDRDLSGMRAALANARGLERELVDDLVTYRGMHPDDIAKVAPHQGATAAIRARRRRMKVRAIDGLPDLTPDERREAIAELQARRASVTDIALALDCSRRYAHEIQKTWTKAA